MKPQESKAIRLALPKGRMEEGVSRLLADAGIHLRAGSRDYRPSLSLDGFDAKLLKPRAVVEMLHAGSRDLGFAGADWVMELGAEVVELLDTGLDPVRLVAAAPQALLEGGALPRRRLVVASEYKRLTQEWLKEEGLDASFVRSYGATEVLPPEDADCIVDNTASGNTLRANGLVVLRELMSSSTRVYGSRAALDDPLRREPIERLVLLLRSVVDARKRVMLEVNVVAARLDEVVAALPCMREPTISPLHGGGGFAVKAAVRRCELPALIPALKARGASDLIVTPFSQLVQ